MRQFKPKQKEAKISFLSALHSKRTPLGVLFCCLRGRFELSKRRLNTARTDERKQLINQINLCYSRTYEGRLHPPALSIGDYLSPLGFVLALLAFGFLRVIVTFTLATVLLLSAAFAKSCKAFVFQKERLCMHSRS